MAIWKSGDRLLMGHGIARKKYERRPTWNMVSQENRLNEALINAGFKPLHNGSICVGLASTEKMIRMDKRT